MKKILLIVLSVFLLVGCDDLTNTPIKRVERFFDKYQRLDDDLLNELSYTTESKMLTNEQKNTYRNLMKKQYSDLVYEIKDEEKDGNIATVKVEIEVYDYSIANKKIEEYANENPKEFLNSDNTVNDEKYIDYKLNFMKDIDERVKYTISLTLTKKNKNWVMDEVSEENLQKIHGFYSK